MTLTMLLVLAAFLLGVVWGRVAAQIRHDFEEFEKAHNGVSIDEWVSSRHPDWRPKDWD